MRKSKTVPAVYAVVWLAELVLLFALMVLSSMFSALIDMGWINKLSDQEKADYYLGGNITAPGVHEKLCEISGIALIIGAVIAVALLILLMVLTGRSSRDEEGKMRLTFLDKVWTEVYVAVAACVVYFLLLLFRVMYDIWLDGYILGIWDPIHLGTAGDMIVVEVTLIAVASVACIAAALLAFTVIVKKLKAGVLWEKSLIGGLALAIYRNVKGSDKTLAKVIAVLIAGAALSATWIGLPLVVVAVIVFVPGIVRKFTELKNGVREVKNGNLDYKIPVSEGKSGIKGELDRLAEDVNEISKAQSIAVQNELKTQRMKTDLISNVSHDLRTPLTSMISYIDLLEREGLDSEHAPEYLEIIDKKTQRLKVLTDSLFDAAKASSGAIPVNIESIDLCSVITQSLAEMEEKLAAKNLDVQVSSSCEDAHILADGQLMWRVMENLLGNISKYALDNSRVYIDVYDRPAESVDKAKLLPRKAAAAKPAAGAELVLEIKNISRDPLNIPADELMERFKRGDESRNTEGSGLGLAIARDLVGLMHGHFDLVIDGDLFKAIVVMKKG